MAVSVTTSSPMCDVLAVHAVYLLLLSLSARCVAAAAEWRRERDGKQWLVEKFSSGPAAPLSSAIAHCRRRAIRSSTDMQAAAAMRYTQAATSSVARAAAAQRNSSSSSVGRVIAATSKRLFISASSDALLQRHAPTLRLSTVQRAYAHSRNAWSSAAPFRSQLAAAASRSFSSSSRNSGPIGNDGGRALVAWGERDGITTRTLRAQCTSYTRGLAAMECSGASSRRHENRPSSVPPFPCRSLCRCVCPPRSAANEFMPVGQLPKSPSLLVIPVLRPVMPGEQQHWT